jgi:hypothetical protein
MAVSCGAVMALGLAGTRLVMDMNPDGGFNPHYFA